MHHPCLSCRKQPKDSTPTLIVLRIQRKQNPPHIPRICASQEDGLKRVQYI